MSVTVEAAVAIWVAAHVALFTIAIARVVLSRVMGA